MKYFTDFFAGLVAIMMAIVPVTILWTLLKHLFLLRFLQVWGGVGSPVELQKIAFSQLLGSM